MEPISESLNRQILALAPRHVAVPDAPNTWRELQRAAYDSAGRLRVFNGASSATIYASPSVNFAFRAWHDSLHLAHGLDFSRESELKIAQFHADQIQGEYDKRLIYADVAAQVEYYFKHGRYVPEHLQRAIVLEYLAR